MTRRFFAFALATLILSSVAFAADKATWVKLVNKEKGLVLAVSDGSQDAGARLQAVKDDGSIGQQWKLDKDGEHLKIMNRKSGLIMDVEGESTDADANVIQWDEKTEGNDNQRWSWSGEGKARRLQSKSSKLVLDLGDDGYVLQKAVIESSQSQLWEVVEVKE